MLCLFKTRHKSTHEQIDSPKASQVEIGGIFQFLEEKNVGQTFGFATSNAKKYCDKLTARGRCELRVTLSRLTKKGKVGRKAKK